MVLVSLIFGGLLIQPIHEHNISGRGAGDDLDVPDLWGALSRVESHP